MAAPEQTRGRWASVIGGGLVSGLGPDLVPDSYRSLLFSAGLLLVCWGLRPIFAQICDQILERKGGRVLLIIGSVVIICIGGYGLFRGVYVAPPVTTAPAPPVATPAPESTAFPLRDVLPLPKRSAPSPSPQKTSVSPPPPPPRLARLLEIEALPLVFEKVGEAIVLKGARINIQNSSDEIALAELQAFKMYLNGQVILDLGRQTLPMIGRHKAIFAGGDKDNPLVLSPTENTVTLDVLITYDAVPPNGKRTALRVYRYRLNWANGPQNFPLADAEVLIEREN